MSNWTPPASSVVGESLGETTASSDGTTLTAGTANTKGSYSEVEASISRNYESCIVCLAKSSVAADFLVDIAIGASGVEQVIIPNLRLDSRKVLGGWAAIYTFPIRLPQGQRLSARVQSSTASATCSVLVVGLARGFPAAKGFSRAIAIGANGATSRGTGVDAGATANTKGSYAELSSSTPAAIAGLVAAIGNNADTGRVAGSASFLFDIAIGASGVEQVLVPNLMLSCDSNSDTVKPPTIGFLPVEIPISTRVTARSQCTDNAAGDRTFDLTLYGLVE